MFLGTAQALAHGGPLGLLLVGRRSDILDRLIDYHAGIFCGWNNRLLRRGFHCGDGIFSVGCQ